MKMFVFSTIRYSMLLLLALCEEKFSDEGIGFLWLLLCHPVTAALNVLHLTVFTEPIDKYMNDMHLPNDILSYFHISCITVQIK